MTKAKTVFVCTSCGHEISRWLGQCPACREWNTLKEFSPPEEEAPAKKRYPPRTTGKEPVPLAQVETSDVPRIPSGLGELDRVLGGGIVPGSLVLLGGDPGIGKSTLLLQVSMSLGTQLPILYVTGEESAPQVRMRADRIGETPKGLFIYTETDMALIEAVMGKMKSAFVVVDSIQTMAAPPYNSAPGSVSQVRECTASLLRFAKTNGCTIFLVGHVTKEGAIAGPRILEHMVDTVLYFEGERREQYRILRAVKNRFGSTNEIGLFQMTEKGMEEVPDASAALLSARDARSAGSAVTCVMEGSRPMLVEIQALVAPTPFGTPRRMPTGLDYNRMLLIMAVLEKRAGMPLYNQDTYLNVAGGLRLDEPSADLAVAAALISSFVNVPLDEHAAYIGEVGLTGEVRPVSNAERRVAECAQLGFTRIFMPKTQVAHLKARCPGMELVGLSYASDLLTLINLHAQKDEGRAKKP